MSKSGISNWGSSGWNLLHNISWNYPNKPTLEEKKNIFNFLIYFASVIPCMRCRRDWTEYLNENMTSSDSVHLSSKDALTRFLVSGHNVVNTKLGKKSMTYKEAEKLYDSDKFSSTPQINIIMVIIIMITLVFIGIKQK